MDGWRECPKDEKHTIWWFDHFWFNSSKQAPPYRRTRVMCPKHYTTSMSSLVKRMGYNVRPIHPAHGWMKWSNRGWKRRVDDVAAPLLKPHQTNHKTSPKLTTSTDNPGRIDEQNVRSIHPCREWMDEGNVRRMKSKIHPVSQPVVERWRVGGKSEERRSWSGGVSRRERERDPRLILLAAGLPILTNVIEPSSKFLPPNSGRNLRM